MEDVESVGVRVGVVCKSHHLLIFVITLSGHKRSYSPSPYSLALLAVAHLVPLATGVGGASHLAAAVDTQLAGQAIAIAIADFDTNTAATVLAACAIARLATLALTQS